MLDIWRIYFVVNCSHTRPVPKDKLIAIVCRDVNPMGFLINTIVHPYILGRADLRACQVLIRAADYKCLDYNSYIDCTELYSCDDAELTERRDYINPMTKAEIQKAVRNAKTITEHDKKLILFNN